MMAAAVKKKKRSDPTQTRPETRRSLRPRQCRYLADLEDELDLDLQEEKKDKESNKLKHVLKLPLSSSPFNAPRSRKVGIVSRHVSASDSSTSSDEDDEEIVKPLKKRRFEKARDSEGSGQREGSKRNVIRRTIRAVSGTPMPEKSTLEEILDKLQKKDTYGVFAEPVDPEELPDYHDVIEHPMDFGTVRKKLASRWYRSFEQFEDDVFLICSNAMQYNAPDTIYFRQAHSIQDMARKSFQEIRADLMCNEAERESENIRSASTEKQIVKKIQCGVASKPSSFNVTSLEKKTVRQPQNRNAFKPLGCDISFMEKKTLKKQFRTAPEARGFSVNSKEEKTSKKPQCKTLPGQPGSNASSIEKKCIKKPKYRSAHEPPCSDASYIEKKSVNKPQYRSASKPWDSDVSSIEKKTIQKPLYRSANEPPCSDVSSMVELEVKKPQYRSAHGQLDSDVSSMEKKKVKKPQYRTSPEPLVSDTYSMETTTLKNPWKKIGPQPLSSDISSQDKKTQQEPLGSDISSGATLASAADTFTGLNKLPANGDSSATDQRNGLCTVQAGGNFLEADTSTELTTVKTNGIEGSMTINGSAADGSSLGDSNPEKADEVPAKCSPSKLAKPFVVDMKRRLTYNALDEQPLGETDSFFNAFEGETRQLVSVGLNSEYSYARSLARFAASLGPVAWDIASKKIEQSLPPGVKFGHGWVGEYEPPLTPILPLGSKDNRNKTKSEAMNTVSKKNNGNERNGQHKDVPFGPKSKMVTGMPPNRTLNSSIEGREGTREQKPGLFGVNIEPQPSSSSSNLAPQLHQKNQPASGVVRAYTNEAAGHRLDIGSEAAKSTFPAMVSKGWNQVQAETQKPLQQKNQVAQVQAQPKKPQQQKNQVASDLAKAHTNDTTMHQPKLLYSEGAVSNIPALSYMGMTQVQTELLKQPETVTSQRTNGDLGMNIRGLNNGKACDISRMNSPHGIISHHQAGVQYWVPRPNQEQAINDAIRWMNKNRCTNNLDRSMLQIPKSENLHTASLAPAQAWMSIGVSNKQVGGSAHFNSTWKNPNPASRVHEDAKIKLEPLQLMTADLSRLQAPWQGLVPHDKQKDTLPPDLNMSFQPSGSPSRSSSSIHMDTQHPDLALQL